ncbi:hypothetical protein HYX06_06480, partial [Candidatus Woesearchaeota archaeon]|nr:hypothetical protein [Candidatus Woesearchaeota archaeon]
MNIKKNSKSNILHIAFAIILIASTFLSLAYQANAVACKVDSPKCCEDGQCGVNQGTINPSKFIRGEAYYKGEECREGVPENCNEDDPDDPRCSVSCDCPPNTKPAREIRYPQADSVQDACKCIKSTSEEYYGQINCCGNEDDDCGRSNNGRYLCVMQRSISQKARISDAISNIGDSVDAPCDGTTYLGTGDRWLECENGFFTPLPENRGPNEFISPGNPKVVRVKEHEYLCRGFGPKSIVECCGTSLANCQSKDSSIVRLIAGQSVIPSAFQSRPRPTPPFTLAVYEDTTNQQTPPTPTPTPTPAPTPTPSGSCNDGNLDPSEDCDMPNYPCGDPDTERCSSCRCVPRRGSQVNQEVDYQVITVNPITGLATGITGDVTSITGMQTATTLTIRVGETKELGEWAITTTAVVEDTLKITFFYQDSAPLTQRKIYIIGIRAGQTTITIRSGSGSTIRTYSVTVQEPLSCTPGQQPLQCTGPNNCQGTQTCQSGIWGTCVCTATNPTTTSSTPSTTPPPSNIGNRIFVAMDLPNKLNDFYLDNSGRDCQIYAKEEDRINRDDKCGANANYGKIISRNGR